MLDSKGDLYAVELAFFVPALLLCIALCIKHGLRQWVWLLLSVLAVLRIIGSAAVLYGESKENPSKSVLETAAITSAVGTAPLLLALMDCLQALLINVQELSIPTRWFRGLQLLSTIGVILAIIGGIRETDGNSTGKQFLEAASLLFLVMFLALLLILILILRSTKNLVQPLLSSTIMAFPFVLVRVIYTICVGFSNPGEAFYFQDPNVWVAAFMQFFTEASVTTIFVVLGLVIRRHSAVKELQRDNNQGVEL